MDTEGKLGSKTELWAIGLVILSTLIGAVGPIMLKVGVHEIKMSFINIIKHPKIIFGAFMMVVSAGVYIMALKGGELSVLYPYASLSYLWVTLISKFYLKEEINKQKIMGIALIILGIVLIGLSNK